MYRLTKKARNAIYSWYKEVLGDRGSTLVKVLRYKSEGRWFDPRWCHGIFHRNMALGWTQPLTKNEYQEYFLGVNAAGT
jgi:hypothetical protein